MATLHSEFLSKLNTNCKPDYMDLKIRKIIEQNNSEDYEHILANEEKWEVFSNLSQLRTSVLNWYEFKENSKLLEIGGNFGALTGMFCDRCAHVTVTETNLFRAESICVRYKDRNNLDVYAGDIEDIQFDHKFDYITIIGQLELQGKGTSDKSVYSNFISKIKKLLKPDGKILIAVSNRYGIRYFCGAKDPHTGKPFEGINHYIRGTSGYSFNKQELSEIIEMAGMPCPKFYYMLPDYRLTQLIYTDSYLPEKNLQERLIPYYEDSDTLVALEYQLYDDLIDNHVFPFFSNSFLIECSGQNNFSSVIYAAVSTDRGRGKSFATTIHSNDIVKKKPLYKEGYEYLNLIYENMRDLDKHNIPVVQNILENNTLVMPYVQADTLSVYLRKLIKTNQEQFEQIIDKLYEYILESSEHIPAERNALITEDTKTLDWGIILRKAYIELIPLNCFYTEGEFLFFDQEFARDNYPAKYILFRALHYIYCFAPYTDAILPLQRLKDKYGLTHLWEVFQKEEEAFLIEVRQHKLYSQFYKWARVDINRINDNIDRLSYRGESLQKYNVPKRLQKIQAVQLDLLEALKDVCDRNHLHYFMIYGTLLGAIRHGGMIPWDDDIDIVLPREDYDKLIKLAASEFKEPYFFQTPKSDPNCFYGGYSKLRNSNTTGIEMNNWEHQCNQGIWIDIFPLDACYLDERKNKRKLKKINFYQRLMFAKVYGSEKKFRDMKFLKWKMFCTLGGLYQWKKLCDKLDASLKECDEKNTSQMGILTHYTTGKGYRQFLREDFKTEVLMNFEYMKLPAPIGYERCLTMSMGNDYMRYPSIADRKPHHKAFFAPNVPYKAYLARFLDVFSNVEEKTIVLFGAGLMFEDYMKKYGKKYPPAFLIDNNSAKWGTTKNGILIKSPNELLNLDKDKLHLIICNIYYRQIETQIRKMGVLDYYIYVQVKEWLTGDPPEN